MQEYGAVQENRDGRHCLYGIFHRIGCNETAFYPYQAECGELVDGDYRDNGVFVFPV